MKNIDMLLRIRELIRECNFIADDISVRLDIEELSLGELIERSDEDVIDYLHGIDNLDICLKGLTEDLKSSMCEQGFDGETFDDWLHQVAFDGMRFVGLFESFQNALQILEEYVLETIRGFRILTQSVYFEESEEERNDEEY